MAKFKESDNYFSLAGERNNATAKWYVDGKDYMAAIADAIEKARHEILIAGWKINPDLHLRRSDNGKNLPESTLNQLLMKKVKSNVKIYILLSRSFPWICDNECSQAEDKLIKQIEVEAKEDKEHEMSYIRTVEKIRKNDLVQRSDNKGNEEQDENSSEPPHCYKINGINVLHHPVRPPTGILRKNVPGYCSEPFFTHHEKVVVIDRKLAFVGGIDLCYGRWDTHAHKLTDAREDRDYYNCFHNSKRSEPRLPWHDVACSFTGEAAEDVASHLIQRYDFVADKINYSGTRPCSMESFKERTNQDTIPHVLSSPKTTNITLRILRSVGKWSIGDKIQGECSIQKAYCNAIEKAEHFIYIENQYFSSSQPQLDVNNTIQDAIYKRIIKAHEEKQPFHVILILPLKPEFREVWDSRHTIFQLTYRNYSTLFHHSNSLMEKLRVELHETDIETVVCKYFSVYGLRQYGTRENGNPMTEIIYVHSKVMIVDDRQAIIGSANINDRSMRGYRDSEVCVLIKDNDMTPVRMGGKENYHVGKFSRSLRCHLLKEHLGLLDEGKDGSEIDMVDPVCDDFIRKLSDTAKANTAIFEKGFDELLPSNEVECFEDVDKFSSDKTESDLSSHRRKCARVDFESLQGRLVTYPSNFLKKELEVEYGIITVKKKLHNYLPFADN